MTFAETTDLANKREIEKFIEKAIQKVCGDGENDLCRYLPGPSGGYMHHFTLKKLKNSSPDQLLSMLKKFVLDSDSPRALTPKQRAPRGSKKKKDFVSFTKHDIDRVLELARQVGDKDLLARFSPKKPLPSLKRELVRSIRNNQVDLELWNAYVEAIKSAHHSINLETTNAFS